MERVNSNALPVREAGKEPAQIVKEQAKLQFWAAKELAQDVAGTVKSSVQTAKEAER